MTKEVEWKLREVTKYELVRSYYEVHENGGNSGGSTMLGTYDTEEQGRHAMRVFKDAETADLQNTDQK